MFTQVRPCQIGQMVNQADKQIPSGCSVNQHLKIPSALKYALKKTFMVPRWLSLVERLPRKQQAAGSKPARGSLLSELKRIFFSQVFHFVLGLLESVLGGSVVCESVV